MIKNKISETEYEVLVYDWVEDHDDYVCGHIKRDPTAEDESDLRFWMFYPIGAKKPINAGDMRKIFEFTASMNKDI